MTAEARLDAIEPLWSARVAEKESWSTPLCIAALHSVFAVTRDGLLVCYDAGGQVRFRASLGVAVVSASPSAVVDGDTVTVVVGNEAGLVTAIDAHTGRVRWRKQLRGTVRATASSALLPGTDQPRVFVASYGDHLYSLDATTGREVWRRWLPNVVWRRMKGVVSGPMVADVDGDGRLEIVVGTRSWRTFCLDAETGELKWFVQHAYGVDSTPTLFRDATQNVLVVGAGEPTDGEAGEQAILGLHPESGRVLWRLPAAGGVDSSATLFDHGPTGSPAFVQTTIKSASCICADPVSGKVHWICRIPETAECEHGADNACLTRGRPHYFTDWCHCRSYTVPVVSDVLATGTQQVLFGSCNGTLNVADANTGTLLGQLPLGGIVRGSPLLVDLDGDGRDELIVQAGPTLHVFRTRSKGANWWMFKGTPSLVGDMLEHPGHDAEMRRRGNRRYLSEGNLVAQWLVRDLGYYAAEQVNRRILRRLGLASHRWKY